MQSIRTFFETEGVILENAVATAIGPLHEVHNVWRVSDHGHFARATATLGDERVYARYADVLATMQEIVESEELTLVQTMPFFG